MKKTVLLFALVITCINLNSQTVNYKVLEDNPQRACNFAMGIELMQMDFGMKNIDGWAFSTGVWGFADYKRRLGADYILRYGYLTLGKLLDKDNLKAHRQIELGGYLNFKRGLVNRKNKVVLKVDKSTTATHEVTTTTFVMVPSTQYVTMGARAGFMNYGGCLMMSEAGEALGGPGVVNYNVVGLYAGLFKEKLKCLMISTDSYGKKGVALHTRFYIDALLTPISSVKYKDIDYKSSFTSIPVGARMGVSWFPVLTRKEARPDYPHRFLFQTEVGYRSYDGLYFTGTISIPISKHISRLSDGSDKPKVEKETE